MKKCSLIMIVSVAALATSACTGGKEPEQHEKVIPVKTLYIASSTVNKGQLLASLNPATAQSSVEAAQASFRQAQDAYDRLSKLHEAGSLPDIKFAEVETGLQQSKSMFAVAQKNLDDCRLYAPRAGVIAARSIEPGANAMPGVAAFQLITTDEVEAKMAVPDNEIGNIFPKQEAVIEATALGGKRFEGKIETKGVSAHPPHTYLRSEDTH
jgi:multidrug resistance efflux pump